MAGVVASAPAYAATPVATPAAIIGGDAKYTSSVVALLDGAGQAFCSGTLIRRNVVITAAHCINGNVVASVRKTDNTHTPGPVVAVQDAIAMPAIGLSPASDVALLLLAAPLQAPVVALAPRSKWLAPPLVRVIGFGVTEANEAGVQRERSAAVLSVDPATFRHGESACSGDSGGAVIWDSAEGAVLVGVISSGPADCREYATAVRVDFVRAWVDAVLTDIEHARCEYVCAANEGGCAVAASSTSRGWLWALAVLLSGRKRRRRCG